MNSAQREALDYLLTYNWADEEADYAEQDRAGKERHIFGQMLILRDYLGTHGLVEGEEMK